MIYLSALPALQQVGGFQGLLEKYPQAVPGNVSAIVVNSTCHWPDRQAFRMLRDADDPYMPWLGFLLGQTPGSIWYWCADQVGGVSVWYWCADQVGICSIILYASWFATNEQTDFT